jgi:hypothetical protein
MPKSCSRCRIRYASVPQLKLSEEKELLGNLKAHLAHLDGSTGAKSRKKYLKELEQKELLLKKAALEEGKKSFKSKLPKTLA